MKKEKSKIVKIIHLVKNVISQIKQLLSDIMMSENTIQFNQTKDLLIGDLPENLYFALIGREYHHLKYLRSLDE